MLGLGKNTHIVLPKSLLSSDAVPLEQVASAQVVTEVDSLARRAGWAMLGAAVLGPAGMLAGVLAGKKQVVAVEFKDGRRALLECGSEDLKSLVSATYGAPV